MPQTLAFLEKVASAALTGRSDTTEGNSPVPLPLHARTFLKDLTKFVSADAAAGALKPLLRKVADVSRRRRMVVVAGCLAFPVFAAVCGALGLFMMAKWNETNPDILQLSTLLHTHSAMHSTWTHAKNPPSDRLFEVYIASHYGAAITNSAKWSGGFALMMINGEARKFAEKSVAEYPAPSDKEIEEAETALKEIAKRSNPLEIKDRPVILATIVPVSLALYVCIPALIAALVFRGGLVLLAAGITFVRRDGVRASRLRVFWRALVAWVPVLAIPLLVHSVGRALKIHTVTLTLLALGLAGVLVVWSLLLPKRGLPDRLAGTWPVPR